MGPEQDRSEHHQVTNEARRFLIYTATVFFAGGGVGGVGGRMSAPVAPPEVRYVHVPAPAPLAPPVVEATPVETPAPAAVEPAPQVEPPIATAPLTEVKPPLPAPRPKVEAKPKEQPKPQKARVLAPKKSLPSCAAVKREYERMTMAQRWDAYRSATPDQIAHGKRCLGF